MFIYPRRRAAFRARRRGRKTSERENEQKSERSSVVMGSFIVALSIQKILQGLCQFGDPGGQGGDLLLQHGVFDLQGGGGTIR